jgi:hypothetical protein
MPMFKRGCVVLLVIAASACSSPTRPSTPSTISIFVTGTEPAVGQTSQLTAKAILSNGTQDVTTQATWSSSNSAVATVTTGGLLTVLQPGTADITATYQGVSGKFSLSPGGVGSPVVSGTVTELTSGGVRPIEGANIYTSTSGGAHGVTDAAGHYQLAGLRALATMWVTASKDRYVPQCAAPPVTLHGDTQVDLQLVSKANLSASSSSVPTPAPGFRFVSGVIFETTVAGKQPVPGAFVDWEPTEDFPAAVTFSDAAGRYLLCGLPDGQTIDIGAVLVPLHISVVSVPPGQSTGVDIELK